MLYFLNMKKVWWLYMKTPFFLLEMHTEVLRSITTCSLGFALKYFRRKKDRAGEER